MKDDEEADEEVLNRNGANLLQAHACHNRAISGMHANTAREKCSRLNSVAQLNRHARKSHMQA